jgi:dolichyl-phosphate-mannose--protein O-mannosyl transferase
MAVSSDTKLKWVRVIDQPIRLFVAGHDFRNRTVHIENKPAKKRNFFLKFAELQILMLQHNAGLTASHPYESSPFSWPFLMSGISFWTENDQKKQVYLIGNVASWWICVMAMSVFVGVIGADTLARRRGIEPIENRKSWARIQNIRADLTAVLQVSATV